MKLIKYLYRALMIKDMLDDGVNTLAYFHKDCNKWDKSKNNNNNDNDNKVNDNNNKDQW